MTKSAAYLVRNRQKKTLLGLFVAPNLEWLWDTVDEVADPVFYEYRQVSNGALYFSGQEPACASDEDPKDDDSVARAELSEMLLREAAASFWKPLDSADQGFGLIARVMREKAARHG